MKIGGLQKTSLIEFPGKLSCIIFAQGCNLRCPFCHNPELVLPEQFSPPLQENEVLSFLGKRKEYLKGIVLSGGEPCFQKDLPLFLKEARNMGYAIKLDTNGTIPDMIRLLIEEALVDYIAMDVKAPLEKYRILTGVETNTRNIEESISIIRGSGIEYEFKTTVVFPLLDKKDFEAIGKLVKNAGIHYVQRFSPSKTLDSRCMSFAPPGEEDMEEIRRTMLKNVRECRIR